MGVEYATSWSWALPAPLVAAALLAEPEPAELVVESEDPPQPASTAATPIATIAVVKAARRSGVIVISFKSPCQAACFGIRPPAGEVPVAARHTSVI